MINKEKFARGIVQLAGFVFIIAAGLLLVWSILSRNEFLQEKYSQYRDFLDDFELRIMHLENKWVIIVVIELLFLIGSLIPLIPPGALFFVSGMVFKLYYALLIDIVGLSIYFSLKYYMGYKRGGGMGHRLLRRNGYVRKIFEHQGNETPLILFLCRFLPFIPANQVSRIFGAFKFDYRKYLAISIAGFFPRMISFNYAGRQVFDPFSVKFTTPLIAILLVFGASMLAVNEIMEYILKKEKKTV